MLPLGPILKVFVPAVCRAVDPSKVCPPSTVMVTAGEFWNCAEIVEVEHEAAVGVSAKYA